MDPTRMNSSAMTLGMMLFNLNLQFYCYVNELVKFEPQVIFKLDDQLSLLVQLGSPSGVLN